MSRRRPAPRPRIDPLRLEGLDDGDPSSLAARGYYEGQRFTGIDATDHSLSGATFSECEVIDGNADGADLQGVRLVQTRLTRLNAAVLSARRTTWRDAEILASRLGAVEWYDSEVSRLVVAESKLDWVNWRSSQLQDVLFRACTVGELDLTGATVTRMAFEDTTLDRLVLTGCRAQHLDLRGAEIGTIEGIEGLRGTVLSGFQVATLAPLLAAHLGITIEP